MTTDTETRYVVNSGAALEQRITELNSELAALKQQEQHRFYSLLDEMVDVTAWYGQALFDNLLNRYREDPSQLQELVEECKATIELVMQATNQIDDMTKSRLSP